MITAYISSMLGLGEEYGDYGSVRGNGKTISMVYDLFLDFEDGRTVFTNFETNFSIILPMKKIILELKNNPKKYFDNGISVGITEIQTALNSLGGSTEVIKTSSFVAAQTRKTNCDFKYDLQIFKELNNRFRNQTDIILRPAKFHKNGEICLKDKCSMEHWIEIYGIKPDRPYNILGDERINCQEMGKKYNTNEVVFDEFELPKKKNKKVEDD
jgi:hypothetical protein